jgi:carboxylesterase
LQPYSYSCSDPAITDDLLDGSIFDRHYIIPNNSWCLQNTLIPQQQIWINISSLLFMAIRLPLLSGRNLRTGQLRLLPIEFQVLLDGHGRDYESFKASTWQDWSSAIKREYEKLEALGYTKISIVGSSTGGTLLLE